MRAILEPKHYVDQDIFSAEQKGLFSRYWLFACLQQEVKNDGDFMRLDMAGRDIILRNNKGKLHAFANACSHRHARLCAGTRGHGPIRCPYHGWVYNGNGVPVGIPHKEQFPLVLANPEAFRLTEFETGAVGQFVFVRFSQQGPTLESYLGEHATNVLRNISDAAESLIDEFTSEVPANWKVVIENSLEGYHVPMVHSRTLGAADGMAGGYQGVEEFFDSPFHSYVIKPAAPDWLQKWKRKSRHIGTHPFHFDHYFHYLLFPNLTVTSFLGYSFHVQRFDPVNHRATRVHSRILTSKFENQTEMGRKMMEHIHQEGISFTHQVFFEDEGVCKAVQAGLEQSSHIAVLADDHERRIAHFQKTYTTAQNTGQASRT